jgi:hypothetical protein
MLSKTCISNVRAIFPEKKNINTFDFQNVKSLAEYLLSVGSSEEKYTALLKQKHNMLHKHLRRRHILLIY